MKTLTKTNLTKREQTFLLRLVSSTLPTMEMVHNWKGVGADRDGYEFLRSAVLTDDNETSDKCPLQCKAGASDTQGHWVECKSLAAKWKDEMNCHWKSMTGQLPSRVDLLAVYENNEINYAEKCGLIKKKTLMDLFEIDEKDLTPWKMTLIRKTLLKVATAVWYYKQNLLST